MEGLCATTFLSSFIFAAGFLSVHSTQWLKVQVWFLPSAALFYNLFVFVPKSQHCLAKRIWKLGSCTLFHSAWLLSIAWFKFSQEISIIKLMSSKSQHVFSLGPQDVRLSSQPSPSLVLFFAAAIQGCCNLQSRTQTNGIIRASSGFSLLER